MPFLHFISSLIFSDLIPEVNYTTATGEGNNNRNHGNSYNPNPRTGGDSGAGHGHGPGTRIAPHNPKNPVFVPSPVSSNRSPTMYKGNFLGLFIPVLNDISKVKYYGVQLNGVAKLSVSV